MISRGRTISFRKLLIVGRGLYQRGQVVLRVRFMGLCSQINWNMTFREH